MLTRQKVAGAIAAGLMGVGFLLMVKAVIHQGPIGDEEAAKAAEVTPRPGAGAVEWTTPPAGETASRRTPVEVITNDPGDAAAMSHSPAQPAAEEPATPAEQPSQPDPPADRVIVYQADPSEDRAPAHATNGGQPVKPAAAVKVKKEDPKQMTVAEAVLCRDVKNREAVKAATSFSASIGKVYCWVRIANGEKHKVRMVWKLDGKPSNGEWLEIGSPWWRTWSYKSLPKGFTGAASVEVVDEAGTVLKKIDFKVTR